MEHRREMGKGSSFFLKKKQTKQTTEAATGGVL